MLGVAWLATAAAHSAAYGVITLDADPVAPGEVWGIADGWGLVHSADDGASWDWLCEESVGSQTVYDVLTWAPSTALLGTAEGLMRVGEGCVGESFGDLPEGFVLRLRRYGNEALVALVGPERGGVYRCGEAGCVATSLEGEGFFPKSMVVDGGTVWVTVVHAGADDGLRAELWLSVDGATFTEVYAWPDGDVDPRVLWASGDRVYAWLRPRSDTVEPAFARSVDGGVSFSTTFSTGYYTDPTPGAMVLDDGDTVLLGSASGARTWVSHDGGAGFTEVSLDTPAVKCGLSLGDRALVCTDHLADGFDVASTVDGADFTPVVCLEEVEAAACTGDTCDPYVDAWVSAGAYGGGRCHPADEDTGEPPPSTCDCASGGEGAGAGLGVLVALAAARRRQGRAST
jgi:MYXO-CTERM domain-containing protein